MGHPQHAQPAVGTGRRSTLQACKPSHAATQMVKHRASSHQGLTSAVHSYALYLSDMLLLCDRQWEAQDFAW